MFKTRRKTKYGVIHSSATPANMDIGVHEIRSWHIKKGYIDIGYHIIVRRNGEVEFGRPIDTQGAHSVPVNKNSVGICLVGGADSNGEPENNFTEDQFETLKYLVEALDIVFGKLIWVGHRDVNKTPTACPSFNAKKWIKDNRTKDLCEKRLSDLVFKIQEPEHPDEIPPTIAKGARGERVKLLQRLLEMVDVDGIFGPNTKKEVKKYQKEYGLDVDGIVGPNTWSSLMNKEQ